MAWLTLVDRQHSPTYFRRTDVFYPGIVLNGLRTSTPPQEILKSVFDGPVSELLKTHALPSLDSLLHSTLAKLDTEGTALIEFGERVLTEVKNHLVAEVLAKLSSVINETGLADQVCSIPLFRPPPPFS